MNGYYDDTNGDKHLLHTLFLSVYGSNKKAAGEDGSPISLYKVYNIINSHPKYLFGLLAYFSKSYSEQMIA